MLFLYHYTTYTETFILILLYMTFKKVYILMTNFSIIAHCVLTKAGYQNMPKD